MKRIFLLVTLLALSTTCTKAGELSESASMTSCSIASGGAFVSVTDNEESIFINPAGFVLLDRGRAGVNFLRYPRNDVNWAGNVTAAYPFKRTVVGLGWSREGSEDGTAGDVISLAVASRFIKGTIGSFLSGGASIDFVKVSDGNIDSYGAGLNNKLSASVGAMLRPLPVISIAFSMRNIGNSSIYQRNNGVIWQRLTRWGVAFLWRERVYVMYERDYIGGKAFSHYGFLVKGATPLELMGGFYSEKVSGGVRWRKKAYDMSLSFRANGDGRTLVSSSVGIAFGKGKSKGKYQY